MIKCKLILPMLAAVAMAGCVTTEQMPDGTTKIRFSDEAVSSLTSMMPTGVVNGMAGGTGIGGLDLIPTMNHDTGEFLYLDGRFDYECTAALLYSAKSGAPLNATINNTCRQQYLIRQQENKMAGKPYDHAAPAFSGGSADQAYWASLSGRLISQLAAQNQFKTRFASIPRYDNTGKLFITVGFLGRGKGDGYSLVTNPQRTPVAFSDPAAEAQVRSRASRLKTDLGESTRCDVVLATKRALDKGPKPAGINASDYARYEVQFTVASMSCKNKLYELKGSSTQ